MRYPRATEDQFTASRFKTAKDKQLTVNATVRFFESGMQPDKLTKRAYEFFTGTLSMSHEYNQQGFIAYHLATETTRSRFLAEVRRRVDQVARLDTDRDADMARLFLEDLDGLGNIYGTTAPYGSLLQV
jgi:hypothetical protein